ncbi:hypothetical protein JTE90_002096 [Oedothorax gibbosus]|uniref:THAP-type domain-containing protein n=1 Tax=Oedothorax gibbosus TaxID=931172 RepID=A0AAV6V6E4_9ARAC|nr:hypothetical protein JTE90_002096 [Oedothorax gibbosus]
MSRKLSGSKCLACGISYSSSQRLYCLPKDLEKRKKWLTLLKCEDLFELDPNYVRNNGKVCDKHFQEWAFTSSLRDRLIRNALPNSDPPPVYPIVEAKSCEVVQKPQYRVLKLSKAHIEELKKKQGKIIWNREGTIKPSRLSTSSKNGHSEQPPSSLTLVDRNSEQPSSLISVDRNGEQPSSPASVVGNCDQPSSPASSIGGNCDQPSSPPSIDDNRDQLSFPTIKVKNCEQPSLPFSVIKPSNLSLPKSSPVTGEYKLRKKIFTKKAQHDQSHLYELIATQRKEIYSQRKIIKHLRKKMGALQRENLNFQKTVMDKLNTERYDFLKSLIKQLGTKKIGGMRWSDKDKEFAYACYVLSPQVYKMLRFKLGFPSKSTLRRQMGLEKSGKSAKQASRAVNQVFDESNGEVDQMSESNRQIDQELDESNESLIEMSESGGTLEVDESTIAVNHLMGQGQTLPVNESTGAFFQFIESMNESQVREVVEIIESVP